MEIQQGNKLIAEFMGVKVEQKTPNEIVVGKHVYRKGDHQSDIDFNCDWVWGLLTNPKNSGSFSYHTSWDWLMPVVEKIMNHRYPEYYGRRGKTEDDGEYDDFAYIRTFGIRDKDGRYMVRFNASTLVYGETLIEATWEAVIDFIIWHNNLNNTIA